MKNITITQRKTGLILMEGVFADKRAAIEEAVTRGVSLQGADLRGMNLANAMLDGAVLRGADLAGANLMGANLSEAAIEDCDLRDTTLYGAVFCDSDVRNCNFSGALCGGTDVAAARVERCLFSSLSAVTMNFRDCDRVMDCAFHDEMAGQTALFSKAPVYIGGLDQPVIVFDTHIRIGGHMIARSVWTAIANDNWPGKRLENVDSIVLNFVRRHSCLMSAVAGLGII